MTALALIATALSLLVLAGHFLRPGNLPLTLVCLGLVVLTVVRRRWARRTLQAALALGVAIWVQSLAARVAERRAAGEDWTRLALILGGVAAFTALAALMLEARAARRHFDRG